jgi:hypothetical protein
MTNFPSSSNEIMFENMRLLLLWDAQSQERIGLKFTTVLKLRLRLRFSDDWSSVDQRVRRSQSYTINSQSASLPWYQVTIWDPWPIYVYLIGVIFKHFQFLGSPLLSEDQSAIYSPCWPLLAQSFSGLSPLGHMTEFCSYFQDSSSLEGQVPVFITPGTG